MDDQLLIRVYNVGLGDCIYLRVPDRDRTRHLLIDCGNKYSDSRRLKEAITHLKADLQAHSDTGKARLDLLVATHAHEDHVKGFDPELFDGLQIDRLWMSTAMNPGHPQAEKAQALQALALQALQGLAASPSAALADWAESMLAFSKSGGMDALRDDLLVGERLYVHTETPPERLEFFEDETISLRVPAPVEDIDGVYLGKETAEALAGFQAFLAAAEPAVMEPAAGEPAPAPTQLPDNVSPEDFNLLRGHLTDSALGFLLKEGELVNNTSVVLLLEWRGRRLLFTGDAEVKLGFRGEFQKDKGNGSWNVMWHLFGKTELAKPVDFLKVGHHGSVNATPWTGKSIAGGPHPVNAILDSLLPRPLENQPPPQRYAVVSTDRTNGYPTIPDPALMEELGRRVSNIQSYKELDTTKPFVPEGRMQPQRTDLERDGGKRVPWIEVKLAPV